MADTEKLVLMVTHGPDDPEMATIPFVMAVAALASDVQAVLGFQAEGVRLVKKGVAASVEAPAFPPLAKLLGDFQELGWSAARLRAVPEEPRHHRARRPHRWCGSRRRSPFRRRDHFGHQQPRVLKGRVQP